MRSVFAVVCAVLLLPVVVFADAVPLNPDFVEWRNAQENIRELSALPQVRSLSVQTAGAPLLAERPSPINRTHLNGRSIVPTTPVTRERALPVPVETSFDLRDYGYVPPVRNQNPYGTCWAFGALASMESTTMKAGAGAQDYSEKHLAYFAYTNIDGNYVSFDRSTLPAPDSVYDQGGNNDLSIAMLSRWTGAVAETTEPYENMGPSVYDNTIPDVAPTAGAANARLLKGAYYAPGDGDMANYLTVVGNIKYLVKTYGAVRGSVYWPSQAEEATYYNGTTFAFHDNVRSNSNHAITIVGWDDDFDKTNFNIQPANNGAWIVRNSWGDSWGDGGYYYMSYENLSTVNRGGFAYVSIPVDGDWQQYLHDYLWNTHTYYYETGSYWMANVFEATGDQYIRKVGLTVSENENTFTIAVYTNVTGDDPTNGTLAYTFPVQTFETTGYFTLDLPTPIAVTGGQKFSVVVRGDSLANKVYVPFEGQIDGWSSKVTASVGESFTSTNGSSWTDVVYSEANSNLCIRAYAGPSDYTITASTSVGGIITPYGAVDATTGGDQTFTINPVVGYEVTDVLVDGVSVGVQTSYTFSGVNAAHTIEVVTARAGNTNAMVEGGQSCSFEIRSDNSLWAWGNNQNGRLGDGTTTNRLVPVKIGDGYAHVSSGWGQTIAVKTDGTLQGWGGNTYGRVGDGTTTERHSPVNIGSGFTAAATGSYHSLGLKADGTLWAWGFNDYGQFGNGSATTSYAPVQVGTGYTAITAGPNFTLGLKKDGSLWSWGQGNMGQLGDGNENDSVNPVKIGDGFVTMSAGQYHGIAVKRDGTLWSWGFGDYGQLGTGNSGNGATELSPVQVGTGYAAVSASNYFSLALKADGTLMATGSNGSGVFGDGTSSSAVSFRQVGTGYASVSAGLLHVLGVTTDGNIWAWGSGSSGALGNNTTVSPQATPVQVGVATITSSTTVGGTVSPYGDTLIAKGGSQTYTIAPASGYEVTDVLVDGVSVGVQASYTFSNVTEDHTIAVTTARVSVASVSAGDHYSVEIKPDGSLWAWGHNSSGQLGNGTTNTSLVPVEIGAGYAAVSTGLTHTLAVKSDGTLQAWGNNDYGKLGDGTTAAKTSPANVDSGFATVAAGSYHSLGLKADGTVWAWGRNTYGQLGDGSTTDRSAPVQVGSDYTALAAGEEFSLGLQKDGTVWAWGRGHTGQLGQGDTADSLSPVKVGDDFIAVSAGRLQALGIKRDGTLWGWGINSFGQLGTGDTAQQLSPVQVGTGYQSVSAGSSHTLAVKTDGTLMAAGTNSQGQLGDGTTTDSNSFIEIGSDYAFASAGNTHSLALTTDGKSWAWGANGTGALGNGTTANQLAPTEVGYASTINSSTPVGGIITPLGDTEVNGGSDQTYTIAAAQGYTIKRVLVDGSSIGAVSTYTFTNVIEDHTIEVEVERDASFGKVAGGAYHSLMIDSGSKLWAWGRNHYGQLGDDTTADKLEPVGIGTGYMVVAGGFVHSLGLKADGTLMAWGANGQGQLGDGTISNRLIPVQVGTGYAAIAAGNAFSLGLKADGTLMAWGYNGSGNLGDGTVSSSTVPVEVGTGFTAVAAGHFHALGLKKDGTLWAWGHNSDGQVGDGSTNNRLTPYAVASGVKAMGGGSFHSLFVKFDGALWSMGGNADGQLGDGTTSRSLTPISVSDGYAAVSGGANHSLGLKSDGTLMAWGYNGYGQLGIGSTTAGHSPVQVETGFAAIATGENQNVALKSDGTFWSWGRNEYGQVGNGDKVNQTSPVQIDKKAVNMAPIYQLLLLN